MSIGSISDALTRVTAIEQQLQSLSSGSLLDSELGVSSDSSSDSSAGATQTADTGSTDFANALAQAQNPDSASATDPTTSAEASTVPSDTGASFGSLADSALATGTPTTSTLTPAASSLSLLTGGVAPTAPTVGTTATASTALTSSQQQFASTLSADTGLNPSVVTAWLLSEESGSAAQTRQAAGNNDWLNVGYTDSATFGAQDPIWSDPVTAANATAQWLQGQNSVAGYGTASAGVQAILSSVGQTPAAQVQAIQDSGWASGGYPSLGTMYSQVVGV
jgi:hypothetical protein